MKVYVGMSDSMLKLPGVVEDKLDDIMSDGHTFLFGYPEGGDRLIREYVLGEDYPLVVLYGCEWDYTVEGEIHTVACSDPTEDEDRSEEMRLNDAEWGFIVWKNGDNDVLMTAAELLVSRKPVTIYAAHNQSFYYILDFMDLIDMIVSSTRSRANKLLNGYIF